MSDTFEHLDSGRNQSENIPAGTAGASSPQQKTPHKNAGTAAAKAMSGTAPCVPGGERRRRRRTFVSAPVRVRGLDVTEGVPDEVSTTLNVSSNGVLFASSHSAFAIGMIVSVTLPFTRSPGAALAEQGGRVARVTRMPDGRWSVAVALGVCGGKDQIDAARSNLLAKAAPSAAEIATQRPLVIAVDADSVIRESLKVYLTNEGYEVIALRNAAEGRQALDRFTPALLIAEIEGEDLPGYELCAHVKATPRLQTVPVMLLTSSAYPSDYANAHSLGAVVCMAKPYRQKRLGNVVQLLAPTQQAKERTAPVRPVEESRRGSCKERNPQALNSVQSRRDSSWLW